MKTETTEVLVVGGGQAGLAMSAHLSAGGTPHVVLERGSIAQRWRSERWDSLVANGPAWHDRFPTLEFEGVPADGFATKEQVACYFCEFAQQIGAPVRCGVEVNEVTRHPRRGRFLANTSEGQIDCRYVVAATGPFQRAQIPPIVPAELAVTQIHSSAYRRPAQLPDGAVLVVGAGSSGVQIAEELLEAGRRVYLSVGPHERPPRRYRGRDFVWWLGVLGQWEAPSPPAGAEHVTIAVSGAGGGKTVDFRDLERRGITLVGVAEAFTDGKLRFRANLAESINNGDASYRSLLSDADGYVDEMGLDLPEERSAHRLGPLPDAALTPLTELDLQEAGIGAIVWATGFTTDYSWLQADTFDAGGRPCHSRGVARERGVYFLGLPWLSCRGSSFIWGVWHDAQRLASHIQIQTGYMAHHETGGLPRSQYNHLLTGAAR